MVTAIKDQQTKHPGELITIFYAGCGPYAPFVCLIAPLFNADEIQFSVLEINENSLTVAKKLITTLELEHYVKDYYLADAVTFKVPDAKSYHILFSETLDALLFRECYVPILFNMLPQFREDVTLIPENVIVDVSLLTDSVRTPHYKEDKLCNAVDARKAVQTNTGQTMPTQLADVKVNLETVNMADYNFMLLDTKVHVYKDIWLDRSESSLTLPLEMELAQPFHKKEIIFTYFMDPEIELKCALN
jgi:predicted RNA methylase